jgi:predicted  nucleic acid-binding Zn-ribbon protein
LFERRGNRLEPTAEATHLFAEVERTFVGLSRISQFADELRTRRAGLPERAACAGREAELAALARLLVETEARRAAIAREERLLEAKVADVGAKARELEARLYSGEIKALKELEALQQELGAWQRRRGEEEAAELALLEQEEHVAAELAALGARRAAVEAELGALRSSLAAAEAALDAELARLQEARGAASRELDASLLRRYETLRAAPPIRGRAAVHLADGACLGCSTSLPIAFLSGLHGQPEGATALCPRCGRILVL